MRVCLACEARFAGHGDDWTCARCGGAPERLGRFPAFAPELAASDEGWDSAFAERLARSETRHFWFRARNRLVAWALERYFPAAESLLEVGCGSGVVLAALRAHRPVLRLAGSDLYREGLELARERVPDATLVQMDARRVPFEAEFDVVGAFDVLEHVEDDGAVLAGLRRAVRPGGGLLVTVPAHPRLWSVTDDYARHRRRYRRGELEAKLEGAGFRLLRSSGFVSLLLPAVLLSRRRLPRAVEDFDPSMQLDLDPRVNAALEAVMGLERALIRAGCSFPVGNSRLAVARAEA